MSIQKRKLPKTKKNLQKQYEKIKMKHKAFLLRPLWRYFVLYSRFSECYTNMYMSFDPDFY